MGLVTIAEKVISKLSKKLKDLKSCFEAFLVFNIEYSFDSQNIWKLLLKLLWFCETKIDRIFSTVEHLVK